MRFKTSMLRSILYDYSDAYILVKGTIKAKNTAARDQPNNGANKQIISKSCAPFINFIARINKTQVDDAHDFDAVMSMYNLIEYSDKVTKYSKKSGILWQYCKDEPALNPADNNAIIDFNANNATTNSFKIKLKITGKTGKTGNNGTKDVEIMIALK